MLYVMPADEEKHQIEAVAEHERALGRDGARHARRKKRDQRERHHKAGQDVAQAQRARVGRPERLGPEVSVEHLIGMREMRLIDQQHQDRHQADFLRRRNAFRQKNGYQSENDQRAAAKVDKIGEGPEQIAALRRRSDRCGCRALGGPKTGVGSSSVGHE